LYVPALAQAAGAGLGWVAKVASSPSSGWWRELALNGGLVAGCRVVGSEDDRE